MAQLFALYFLAKLEWKIAISNLDFPPTGIKAMTELAAASFSALFQPSVVLSSWAVPD